MVGMMNKNEVYYNNICSNRAEPPFFVIDERRVPPDFYSYSVFMRG